MSMSDVLKRLRAAVIPGSLNQRGLGYPRMNVRVSDVEELLRDYDRIDSVLRGAVPVGQRDMFKSACRLHTSWTICRYLMSCSHGREDGAEKALRHGELCAFYVAAWFDLGDVDLVRRTFEDAYQEVHDATQVLTDNLDTEIGFPMNSRPELDEMWPKFFERFHDIAVKCLAANVGEPK